MKILVDTQALILAGRNELPALAAKTFCNANNQIYFSLVSLWEIGLKASLGKLHFPYLLSDYRAMLVDSLGLYELNIAVEHIQKAVSFPLYHRDPFDRLIIAQALTEDLTLMGSDRIFSTYGCKLIWES